MDRRQVKEPPFVVPVLLIFSLLLAIYAPVWLIDYFFHDDVLFFLKNGGQWSTSMLAKEMMAHGRFILAQMWTVIGWFIHTSMDLKLVRLLDLLFMAVFGAMLARVLAGLLHDRFQAVLTVVAVLTLPAFASFADRASNFCFPFAMAAALLSVEMLSRKKRMTSALLFFAALSIYQDGAMVFWPVSFFVLLSGSINKKLLLKNICVVALGTQAVYAAIVWISGKFLDPAFRGGVYNPFAFSTDPWEKFSWFVHEPLANLLHGWALFPVAHVWLWFLIWLGLATTAVVWKVGLAWRQAPLAAFSVLVLLLLSYLPNLLINAKAPFYRCALAMAVVVFCLLILFIKEAANRLASKQSPWLVTAVLVFLVAYGGIQAQTMVMQARVLPSVKEVDYTKGVLAAMDTGRYQLIQIIRRPMNMPGVLYDEWGAFTTDFRHNVFPFVMIAAADGWCRGIFPYVSSQERNGRVDYCMVQGIAGRSPDGRRSFGETGTFKYMRFFLPELNGPDMTYYYHEGYLYFLFHSGPPVTGERIKVDMNDIG